MDYTKLNLDHKRAFLINLRCLAIACALLASITKEGNDEEWAESIKEKALTEINKLSDAEIEYYLASIEHHHISKGGVFKIKQI